VIWITAQPAERAYATGILRNESSPQNRRRDRQRDATCPSEQRFDDLLAQGSDRELPLALRDGNEGADEPGCHASVLLRQE
jgi:hypothetical protein